MENWSRQPISLKTKTPSALTEGVSMSCCLQRQRSNAREVNSRAVSVNAQSATAASLLQSFWCEGWKKPHPQRATVGGLSKHPRATKNNSSAATSRWHVKAAGIVRVRRRAGRTLGLRGAVPLFRTFSGGTSPVRSPSCAIDEPGNAAVSDRHDPAPRLAVNHSAHLNGLCGRQPKSAGNPESNCQAPSFAHVGECSSDRLTLIPVPSGR